MNKKLLALAVAGAFVTPVAMADSSAVEIYGTLSMSVDSVDGGSGGTPAIGSDDAERRMRVSSNTSYIGFKGKEDLGNGLDAHFQIEQTVTMDAGGGTWASGRNNFVGIGSKSWGALDFGLIDSPLKTSTGKLDLFGGGHTLGDYRTLFTTRTASVRAANSVLYTSPNFNGFTLKAQTAAQQEAGSNRSPSFWSASGTYENGPIFAVLAFENNKRAVTAASSIYDNGAGATGFGGVNATVAADADSKVRTWRAGFGYNFGPGKVGIAYENQKHSVGGTTGAVTVGGAGVTTVATAAGAGADIKRTSWHVSGEYNVTKATAIGLQYTKANKLSSNVAGLDLSNTAASQWTLGVKQAMSKRTTAYALYTQVRNQSAIRYPLGGGATGTDAVTAAAVGEDPKAISVGVIHKF